MLAVPDYLSLAADLFHTVDDRLVQALQVDCDRYAPGIEIIAIRITKPKIPYVLGS